jgi:rod shape-determining protein MreC
MESFLNRYRNITVLLLVIFGQLVLLAVQVKNDQDVRVIRVWAVTTVTPVARVVEFFRGGSIGFVRHYLLLHDATEENRKLRQEVGKLRLENNTLRNELATAERAKALQVFQAHTPSKMVAANIIGVAPGSNSKVVLVNRGSAEGVMRGMAVVTPDGIVGKVIAAYPTASEVMLVTDPEFAAGVISQKTQARGTLKGQGTPMCKVDYVPFEEKVEAGEWFYTSGDDRIFPRGFAVGIAKVARPAQPFKEILVEPSALQHGSVEDVLIIVQGAHQAIPETPPVSQPVYIAPAPPAQQTTEQPGNAAPQSGTAAPPTGTEADKLRSIYKSVGDAQNHNFGEGPPGSKPPDFTKLPSSPLPPPPPKSAAPTAKGADTKSGPAPAVSAPKGRSGGNPPDRSGPAPTPPAPAQKGVDTKSGPAPTAPAQKGRSGGNPPDRSGPASTPSAPAQKGTDTKSGPAPTSPAPKGRSGGNPADKSGPAPTPPAQKGPGGLPR